MMQFDYISPKDKLPSYKQEVLIFSIYNDFDVMFN